MTPAETRRSWIRLVIERYEKLGDWQRVRDDDQVSDTIPLSEIEDIVEEARKEVEDPDYTVRMEKDEDEEVRVLVGQEISTEHTITDRGQTGNENTDPPAAAD